MIILSVAQVLTDRGILFCSGNASKKKTKYFSTGPVGMKREREIPPTRVRALRPQGPNALRDFRYCREEGGGGSELARRATPRRRGHVWPPSVMTGYGEEPRLTKSRGTRRSPLFMPITRNPCTKYRARTGDIIPIVHVAPVHT